MRIDRDGGKVVRKCAKMHSLSWVKLTFAVVIFQGIEMGQRKTDSTKRKNRGLYLWWQQEVPTKSFIFSCDHKCQCCQLCLKSNDFSSYVMIFLHLLIFIEIIHLRMFITTKVGNTVSMTTMSSFSRKSSFIYNGITFNVFLRTAMSLSYFFSWNRRRDKSI